MAPSSPQVDHWRTATDGPLTEAALRRYPVMSSNFYLVSIVHNVYIALNRKGFCEYHRHRTIA